MESSGYYFKHHEVNDLCNADPEFYLHHQVRLLLVEHKASMKSSQALRFVAIPLTSFHDLPVPLILSSVVLCHVLFGLPNPCFPFHAKGVASYIRLLTLHFSFFNNSV
jgi:hypothetical protein